MKDSQANNTRIAKNTLLLYARMLFLMIISLYTSRVILKALGVEDYGIYNVVGGLVAMFSMISASLSSAISRFITYEIGAGNHERLKDVFSSSVTIQLIIAMIFIVVAETIGLWFLNSKLVIPNDRIVAANWCYQLSIFTFSLNLVSVPYNATIIAYERMSVFAYISIFEGIGKLAVAFLILYNPFDKLIYYALLVSVVSSIVVLIYRAYCKSHFEECSFSFKYDHGLLKKMFGFAGWNMIGTASAVLRDQGSNILINLFFGPAVNGARAIAQQVNTAVNSFVQNYMIAMNPQITKSYASGDKEYMLRLVLMGSRFSFYILLFLGLPILLNTDYILDIWLDMVPDHAVLFVQLTIILAMCDCLSHTLVTAILAEGRIKNYMIVVGGLQLLNLPIAYIALYLGAIPESVIIVAIIISQICLLARLLFLREIVGLSIREFVKSVYLNVLIVSVLSLIIPMYLAFSLQVGWLSFITVSVTTVLTTGLVVFFVGLRKEERTFFLSKLRAIKLHH